MIRKEIKLFVLLSLFISMFSSVSYAGFYDSEMFESTVGCGVIGALSYSSASDGDEMMMGALGCVGGIFLAKGIKSYMLKKIVRVNKAEMDNYQRQIDKIVAEQAHKANNGVYDKPFVLKVNQIEKQSVQSDGSVISPTIRTIFVAP